MKPPVSSTSNTPVTPKETQDSASFSNALADAQLANSREGAKIQGDTNPFTVISHSNALSDIQASEKKIKMHLDQTGTDKSTVTEAFIKALGVSINLEQNGMSKVERALAEQDKVTFALLRNQEVRISQNCYGAPIVTQQGQPIELDEFQIEAFNKGDILTFSTSLVTLDENTVKLLAAASKMRMELTKEKVDALIEAGNIQGAFHVLNTSMENAFFAIDREAIWRIAGKDLFTVDYFQKEIESRMPEQNSNDISRKKSVDALGQWLQMAVRNLPPEAASPALDAFMTSFNPNWMQGALVPSDDAMPLGISANSKMIYNRTNGAELYKALCALVEKNPGRADEVAEWLGNEGSPGNALLQRVLFHGSEAVVSAADEQALILSSAINKNFSNNAYISNSHLPSSPELQNATSFGEKYAEASALLKVSKHDENMNPITNQQARMLMLGASGSTIASDTFSSGSLAGSSLQKAYSVMNVGETFEDIAGGIAMASSAMRVKSNASHLGRAATDIGYGQFALQSIDMMHNNEKISSEDLGLTILDLGLATIV